MGTFFDAFAQADFFGKLIFFALFILSCICWVFLIQKYFMIKKIQRDAKQFKKIAEKHKDAILNLSTHCRSPFGHLYLSLKEKTVQILDKNHFFSSETGAHKNYLSHNDIEFLSAHLQTAISKQKERIEKNLFILSTTKTLAPFLGLLGTVWGILVSFGEMQAGHSVSSNSIILGGLATALTTTVLGLLIAIPALIAFNYLKNLSRRFTTEMCDFSHFLLSTIELQYRKVDI